MASNAFRAPKGTNDILPPTSRDWVSLTGHARALFERSGYEYVDTPMFEHTEVFERGVGETSEVVGKQMYTFEDMGGRSLTLRPEGTAPVVRAVLEHNLHRAALPVKVYYIGPFFRQERPQKGRYRQFFQLGIEAIGSDDPFVDAEVIEIAWRLLSEVDVQPRLILNSIGHRAASCRDGYLETLVQWLKAHADEMAPPDRERIATNPLRTFDSKEEKTIAVLENAPLITDHLCDDCTSHFAQVRSLLDDVGVSYDLDPRLVRGLDYYTRTAFEFVAGGLGSQNAVGGGGRYDGLSESLGGPPLPGIGFALGVDRILLATEDRKWADPGPPHVFAVALGDDARRDVFELVTDLRRAFLKAEFDVMGRGMKGQMKDADRSGARWAAIVGADELAAGEVTLKDLKNGDQVRVERDRLIEVVRDQKDTDGAGEPGRLR
ncbi:MAG: histidine--tRNA ligase [Actinobacteria bacterium]|nr:histidine--tRNA ligase [Actinomycetota bacterium]